MDSNKNKIVKGISLSIEKVFTRQHHGNKNGAIIASPDMRKSGQWHTVKNGVEPFINGNYSGKNYLLPGTKDFEYETTFWLH